MILKEKISFISRSIQFLEQNPNKTKIWIRDLYHKVFPTKIPRGKIEYFFYISLKWPSLFNYIS